LQREVLVFNPKESGERFPHSPALHPCRAGTRPPTPRHWLDAADGRAERLFDAAITDAGGSEYLEREAQFTQLSGDLLQIC
jgi:hypothetical protein